MVTFVQYLTKLEQAAWALVNDIESMEEGESQFGPFDKGSIEDGIIVEWPNLQISAAKLREVLGG